MKVLVPGISGRLGRMLAEELIEKGHDVIGIDRRPFHDAPRGVEMHELDIRKRAAEEVFRRVRPNAVIHMATVTHLVHQSEDRYRINLGGTRAVFEHSSAYGAEHVVFVGRHTYYGAAADSPLFHVEDEPPMGLAHFPQLADLVAADLYAGSALWRYPTFTTSVLRMVYTLGPTGHGTLATFLRGARVPTIMGYDPLFHFMHERDVIGALVTTLDSRPRGVFNVCGPAPVPLSVIIKETGRTNIPVPSPLLVAALGRFGLPKLPPGALDHIRYPITVDASAFTAATKFAHTIDAKTAMRAYKDAFPRPSTS
ncbi:MAG: NAD-dependent epimerase/dehydratase family protein [Labilithrix sp.]|nr:NAD-dependent epimerase/dehydratase family protein [Labilithrix sp.]MCW5811852.1 NAD-dependent epimerase/dehydratase family protein [Labilithrix sp.]